MFSAYRKLTLLTLPTERINAKAQKMKDHALIGNFMGFWPTKHALRGWTMVNWNPKQNYDL